MTRRSFLQATAAATLPGWWTGVSPAGTPTRPGLSGAHQADRWRMARDVVRSGALGTVLWGQTGCAGVGPDAWLANVDGLRVAMDLNGEPIRVSTLSRPGARHAESTTIMQFGAGQSIYVARGGGHDAIIRGTDAQLVMGDGQLRVTSCGV